mmetsp:Transcript_57793/g.152041  ORF Transcript_57793/g.152041 Transcript_57793/m.152041 type:complete len:217 (+) Transcript_57793:144-794(+)
MLRLLSELSPMPDTLTTPLGRSQGFEIEGRLSSAAVWLSLPEARRDSEFARWAGCWPPRLLGRCSNSSCRRGCPSGARLARASRRSVGTGCWVAVVRSSLLAHLCSSSQSAVCASCSEAMISRMHSWPPMVSRASSWGIPPALRRNPCSPRQRPPSKRFCRKRPWFSSARRRRSSSALVSQSIPITWTGSCLTFLEATSRRTWSASALRGKPAVRT